MFCLYKSRTCNWIEVGWQQTLIRENRTCPIEVHLTCLGFWFSLVSFFFFFFSLLFIEDLTYIDCRTSIICSKKTPSTIFSVKYLIFFLSFTKKTDIIPVSKFVSEEKNNNNIKPCTSTMDCYHRISISQLLSGIKNSLYSFDLIHFSFCTSLFYNYTALLVAMFIILNIPHPTRGLRNKHPWIVVCVKQLDCIPFDCGLKLKLQKGVYVSTAREHKVRKIRKAH